jgi:hypothetical protein
MGSISPYLTTLAFEFVSREGSRREVGNPPTLRPLFMKVVIPGVAVRRHVTRKYLLFVP